MYCLGLSFLAIFALAGLIAADDSADNIQTAINANQNNKTALNTILAPLWVSPPSFRGTTSILWSCLITIFACIYTALHLNIPVESGWLYQLLTKARWVVTGLLLPEFVILFAFRQFLGARFVVGELNKIKEQRRETPNEVSCPYKLALTAYK